MENKFFGLFGNDSDEKDVIIENNEELCDIIDKPNHESLVNRFVEEINTKQERKKRKNCSICQISVHKYVCPRCSIKTCSVKCSKKHKETTGCSAIRDQLSFVPLKHYNESHLNSDFSFIEKGSEYIQNLNRIVENNPKRDLSTWVIRFAQECQKRRIQYEKMPIAFKRSRSNRSIYLYKEKTIYWDIDFIFPNCLSKIEPNEQNYRPLCFKLNRISENGRLIDIVKDIIEQPTTIINNNDDNDNSDLNQIEEFDFSPYQQQGQQQYQILLKHKSGRYYYRLQNEWTLKRNLEDKIIVEYPILVIVLQEFLNNYPEL
ncbi:Box C/D snoRNA protein 1 [Dermatophagoides pteronyssinus]|uniref:Box C/D snoRNA protein 1 n=1 Tax=Dermatophagoides pteronyssinus TaxID=6956 RepID=A0ABQ8J6W2_DERPT|nr:Box C/D snoRNA protein 1 [Dermatophagoides pteronyssinus]